ncbi:MAG: hypothetical protein H5U08_12780 [Thermogutta sp.]|uniref:hypothetical protein n=1 Tax=Thermogutta sp. TaxID=1962930 RepID=UPI00199DD090|nr:hypothetical protein [Thermogutta sp.]MBC7353229.1 hypothetical protein [Thermogutta sp.]
MASSDQTTPRREDEPQSFADEQSSQNETSREPEVFDFTEAGSETGSDTSILKNPETPEESPAEAGSSSEAAKTSDSAGPQEIEESSPEAAESPEAVEDQVFELPEDELLDLPTSKDYRLVSTTDRPDDVTQEQTRQPADELNESSAEGETSATAVTEATSEPEEYRDVLPSEEATSEETATTCESAEAAPPSTEEGSAGEEQAEEETEDEVLLVRLPDTDRWVPLSELVVQQTGEPLGLAAARWITRLYLKSLRSEDQAAADFEAITGSLDSETSGETVAFPKLETDEKQLDYRERVRKSRPQKSLLGEIVGIVLGGIGGLLIAYYALNFFGGKQYDFANIPLPGIPHTYHHAPAWMKSWLNGLSAGAEKSGENTSSDASQL